VTITNPCEFTTINLGEIPNTLSAPILGSDSLDLDNFPTSLFPFSDSFQLSIEGVDTTFTNQCGAYRIDIIRTDTGLPFTSVAFNQVTGVLALNPQEGDPIGQVNLKMRITLAEYSTLTVVAEDNFFVTITGCTQTITPPSASISDFEQFWGAGKAYDLTAFINLYTITPVCPDEPTFELFLVSDDILIPISVLPGKEIRFNPANNYLTLAKCFAGYPTELAADSMCSNMEFTLTYTLKIRANGDPSTLSQPFTVTFKPDCKKDTIYFNAGLTTSYDYFINRPGSTDGTGVLTITPSYTQLIDECPVVCRLVENTVQWSSTLTNTVVTNLNTSSGVLTIFTDDLSLDGSIYNYELICTSTESTVATLSSEPDQSDQFDFVVNLLDICREAALVAPQVPPSKEIELFSLDQTTITSNQSLSPACEASLSYDLIGLSQPAYKVLENAGSFVV
jgi:hypothetical protein